MTESRSGREAVTETDTWTEHLAAAVTQGRSLTVHVHTRSAVPEYGTRRYVAAVRQRLDALSEQGIVERVERDVWGAELEAATDPASDGPVAPLVDYQTWADRQGATLPFEERTTTAMLIADSYTVLVPPLVTVAVRDEDEVLAVAPCESGEETVSVMDLLTRLESRSRDEESRAVVSA